MRGGCIRRLRLPSFNGYFDMFRRGPCLTYFRFVPELVSTLNTNSAAYCYAHSIIAPPAPAVGGSVGTVVQRAAQYPVL